MAKKRKFKSGKAIPVAVADAAPAKDRISELPEEVLHDILWRIDSPKQAAKSIALSRRWRSVWRSYPVLEFDETKCRRRNSLCKIYRSLDREVFSVQPIGHSKPWISQSRVLEKLLELATERKGENVMIKVRGGYVCFPCSLLSNSGAKTLQLSGISLFNSRYPLALNSLRTLVIYDVKFGNEQIFTDSIASCPLLETIDIGFVHLKLSNVPNLKNLDIDCDCSAKQIEIDAPAPKKLKINHAYRVTKLVLVAPQLEHLQIRGVNLSGSRRQDVISKFPSLKSLALSGFMRVGKNLSLNLSTSPNLQEVKIWASHHELDYIVLDAGSYSVEILPPGL